MSASLLLMAASCASKRPAGAAAPRIGVRQTGIASWYGDPYHGRATASGEIYDMERGDTAAHRQYAFGTWVRVDNLDNGRRTEVRINDRGPFVRGRIIDLSRGAAREIDMLGPGTAKVKLTVIAPRPPPPPPSSATAAARAGCVVQVASFRDEGRAQALVKRLTRERQRAEVRNAGGWWRVVLLPGTEGSEFDARRLLERSAAGFPDARISCAGVETL